MTHSIAYTVLGLEPGASPDDIKKAFRALSKKYHPDKNPGGEERFKEIKAAKDVLLAKDGSLNQEEVDFGLNTRDFNDDAFENLFRHMTARARVGDDIHYLLEITLEEVASGGIKTFHVARLIKCDPCHGRGGSGEEECKQCDGRGRSGQAMGSIFMEQVCFSCGGRGSQVKMKCSSCKGEGRFPKEEAVTVQLKPGIDEGFTMVKKNAGHAGKDGGRPGNFFVHITVRLHPVFHREGLNLHTAVTLPFHIAALGGEIDINTLTGPNVKLKIPSGTQPMTDFRLQGKGLQCDNSIGDLLVSTRVSVPVNLSEKQKELLKEFARS